MHANLNTTLFYDLVLLIECSYWKSTPTLNAKIEDVLLRTITDSQLVVNNNDLI